MRKFLQLLGLNRQPTGIVRACVPPPTAAPVFELTMGDPAARRVRGALLKDQWRSAAELLDAPMSPEDRQFFSDCFADFAGRPRWTTEWTAAQPNSASAWLMNGAQAVKWAWEARGRGYASTVGEDAARTFFSRLEVAEESLHRAAALDTSDPTPWSWMLRSAIGLQLDPAEIDRRFKEAVRRAPSHRQAHSARLQSLCAKWFGSHDQMWDFVRQSTAGVGPGSPLHVLVAEAHIEMWFDATTESSQAGRQYFHAPAVRDSLKRAASQAFGPGQPRTIDCIRNRNYFAFCMWKARQHQDATEHFAAVGNWVSESPWVFAGKPEAAFAEAQSECRSPARAAA